MSKLTNQISRNVNLTFEEWWPWKTNAMIISVHESELVLQSYNVAKNVILDICRKQSKILHFKQFQFLGF